jgi:hypothetical protein
LNATKLSAAYLHFHDLVNFNALTIAYASLGAVEWSGKSFGDIAVVDSDVSGGFTMSGLFISGNLAFQRNTVSGRFLFGSSSSSGAFVRGNCSLAGSHVSSDVQLKDLRVDGSLRLHGLEAVSCDARDIRIGGSLGADAIRLARVLTLQKAIVGDRISILNANVGSVNLHGVDVKSKIGLTGSSMTGSVVLSEARVAKLDLDRVSVDGVLLIGNAQVSESLLLRGSKIGELVFSKFLAEYGGGFIFPPLVDLSSCQYAALRVSWKRLLEAMNSQEIFDASTYRALETSIRNRGRTDWADEVQFNGRWRATRSLPHGTKRWGQYLLEWLSGYGAAPYRLLIVALTFWTLLLLICLGASSVSASSQSGGGNVLIIALEVLVRGDRAAIFGSSSHASRALLDVGLLVRYVVLAFIGLWFAYLSGLMKYRGT